MRFGGGCVVGLLGALLWASPGAAVQPAPLKGLAASTVVEAQFRFPWETKRKPARKPKRQTQKRPPKPKSPAAERRDAPKRQAAPLDPRDVKLPALMVPLGALPRGETQREADDWTALAGQLGPPADPPLLPPEGPAPAPAYVQALLAPFQKPAPLPELAPAEPPKRPVVLRPIPVPPPPGTDEDDDDGTDIHVPVPLSRPDGPRAPVALAPPDAPGQPGVPLPPKRPGDQMTAVDPTAPQPPEPPPGPTAPALPLPVTTHDEDPDCAPLADDSFAVAEKLPPIEGPGVCGGGPLVSLTGVKRKDGGLIKVKPAATLRCGMAKALADFLRDDLAPAAEAGGAELERLDIAGSFQCRGRNGAAGGKMSEHGRANAVDLSGFGLSGDKTFRIFASDLPEALKTKAKSGACERFSTVLGPGSDGFHEDHLHIDLQPRRSKSKLCQWADPEVARAKPEDEKDADAPKPAKADASEKPKSNKDRDEKPEPPAKRGAGDGDEPLPKPRQTP